MPKHHQKVIFIHDDSDTRHVNLYAIFALLILVVATPIIETTFFFCQCYFL